MSQNPPDKSSHFDGCSDDMLLVKRARFEPEPAAQFAKLIPEEWIVKIVIPKGELGVIFGPSGCGKTFLTLDIMMAIARGEAWFGNKVKPGRIVYVAAESANGFRKRLYAYAHYHRLTLNGIPFDVVPDCPNILDVNDIKDLAGRIGKADIIVIDTFARVTPGANENDSKDVGFAIKQCQILHQLTGALIILVHHTGKNVENGARGWSGLKGALDFEISVEKMDNGHVATLTKQKDGQEGQKFGFTLEQVILGEDEDGDRITSCVVLRNDDMAAAKKERGLGKWEQRTMDAFEDLYIPTSSKYPRPDDIADHVLKNTTWNKSSRDTRRQRVAEALNYFFDESILEMAGEFVKRS